MIEEEVTELVHQSTLERGVLPESVPRDPFTAGHMLAEKEMITCTIDVDETSSNHESDSSDDDDDEKVHPSNYCLLLI